MIPVSVRDPASKGALGNKVSAMLAPLPTSVTDPGLRLEIVHSATQVAKAQQAAIRRAWSIRSATSPCRR